MTRDNQVTYEKGQQLFYSIPSMSPPPPLSHFLGLYLYTGNDLHVSAKSYSAKSLPPTQAPTYPVPTPKLYLSVFSCDSLQTLCTPRTLHT